MRQSRKATVAGVASGLGLFVAMALTGLTAARANGDAPIDPAVAAPAEQLGKAFAAVAARVRPSVVSVYSEKIVKFRRPEFQSPFGDDFFKQFFGPQGPTMPQQQPKMREYSVPQHGMGSGMLLDKTGLVLTNYHVVREVDEVKVQLADKSTFEAEIVGTDPLTDVAVIRMKGRLPENLPAVELGDSDALAVGNLVMAVGAPFALAQTVTTGIISATGRSGVNINTYEDFLQTDAAINPGNSGGPLVNMRGQVIGINSAIATGGAGQFAGVGFAIPINMVKAILPTLIKGQKVTRGMLGVAIQEVTPDLAQQFGIAGVKGALVTQVTAGSAAEKAGVKPGDVIVRFDGKDVADTTHLRNMVAATAPGKEVKLSVIRDGKETTLTATLGTLATEKMAGAPAAPGAGQLGKFGLTVQTLTPDLAKQLGYENQQGALITDVAEGTPASVAGLQQGDLIIEAGRVKIASADDLQNAFEKAKAKDTVLLMIKRKGVTLYVVLRLK